MRCVLELGDAKTGRTRLYLDKNPQPIIDEVGVNMPLFSVIGSILTLEQLDYVQVGLTAAGSTLVEAEVYMDDVTIDVFQ